MAQSTTLHLTTSFWDACPGRTFPTLVVHQPAALPGRRAGEKTLSGLDRSQRLQNNRRIHMAQFSGPGDHSGPISGHFRRFGDLGRTHDLRLQHWHSTLTFNVGIQHQHSTSAYNIGIQDGHSSLAFHVGIQHRHSALAFNVDIQR